MPHIPHNVAENDLSRRLQQHLKLKHRGKVRDTYELPNHPDRLLVVATDRISIFDFVLNALVPGKGAALTAMTVFWLEKVLFNLEHHMVAYGAGIDWHFDQAPELQRNRELQSRAIVVSRQNMRSAECIARGFLTGSGLESYLQTGMVCGIKLPTGLHDGSRLPEPIFTPTTKAEEGHDVHLTFDQLVDLVGRDEANRLRRLTLQIYGKGLEYAESRGLIVADTKFEFGDELADEVLTPDSSRFWSLTDWQLAQQSQKSPQGFDKQFVREYGKSVGISGKLDAEDPATISMVQSKAIPGEVLSKTADLYHECFRLLAGVTLAQFQRQTMGIVA